MSPPKAPPPGAATTDVNLLGRVYKVACADGEEDALNEAVVYLDKQMREIRDRGKVTGVDRIAVMAALNIANDLLRERRLPRVGGASGAVDGEAARRRIQAMQSAIEQTLAGQEKLF
ncbi:MAG: cell division protein ZapA [Betaproteobacteria bacterium]